MKKLFKILGVVLLSLVLIAVIALVVLRCVYSDERLKQMALDYSKTNFNREISFDKASIGLKGITLTNFAISEVPTFQAGTFVKAEQLRVQLSWTSLLKKHVDIKAIHINGLVVSIVKNADGTFNFDSFSNPETPAPDTANAEGKAAAAANDGESSAATQETESLGFAVTAKHLIVSDCDFVYHDQETGMTTAVNDINFEIMDFSLTDPFTALISFTANIKQKKQADIVVPMKIDLTLNLAGLNMPQAYVELTKATAFYKEVQLSLTGKVENFQNPDLNITGSVKGITHEAFTDFLPDLPEFSLPTLYLALAVKADLDHSAAQLTDFAIQLEDSSLFVQGPLDWSDDTFRYTLTGKTNLDLEQAVKMASNVDVRPAGTLSGSFKMTDKNDGQDVSGNFQLKDISLIYPPFTLTHTNANIKVTSLQDISVDNLTGLLNGEKLTLNFSYKQPKQIPNYVINATLAKLKLASFSAEEPAKEEDTSAKTDSQAAETTAPTAAAQETAAGEPETPFNLKANLKIGEINIPYLRSEGFTLQADLTRMSSSMKNANGKISFALQPGAITDMDTILKGNKIIRFILLPFGIINSVSKKLNISLFDATSSVGKGEIALTSGEGEYVFTNGLMTINNTSFVSKLTDIKGTGTIDFPNDKLDMKVSATLLTKQTPVVIKIGGSLDNPSGKLDVLNTLGGVVGGILNYKTATGLAGGSVKTAGNVATGAVKTTTQAAETTLKNTTQAAKATVQAIGGLFKKKKDSIPEDSNAEAATGQAAPASTSGEGKQ